MQLIHLPSNRIWIEFTEEETLIHDPFFKRVFKEEGILIPVAMRDEFNGQSEVFLDDPDFQKAFKMIYYPMNLNPKLFELKIDVDKD